MGGGREEGTIFDPVDLLLKAALARGAVRGAVGGVNGGASCMTLLRARKSRLFLR